MRSELDNCINAIENAEVSTFPFLHIQSPKVFSDVYYDDVLKNIPPD